MKVTCERCGTEYNFADERVTEEGAKVKCGRCDHVFRVRKRAFVVTEPASGASPSAVIVEDSEATAGAEPLPEREPSQPFSTRETSSPGRQWTIKKFDGTVMEFAEMTTLQRWIVERKVGPEDQISHNGVKWKRLGSIPDLGPFFEIVQQGVPPTDETAPRPAVQLKGAQPDTVASERAERAARADATVSRPPPQRRGVLVLGVFLVVALLAGSWAQLTDDGRRSTAGARSWLFAATGLDLRGLPPPTPRATPTATSSSAVAVVSATPEVAPTITAVAGASPVESAPTRPAPSPTATAVAVASAAHPAASPKAPSRATVEQLLDQGYQLYSRGKYREAIKKYQNAVDADQNNSEAWALLGLAYLDDNQDELAESCLQSSVRLNARFADSHRYLGLLYSRRGDKSRAVIEFNTYLDLRPTGPASDDVRKRVASLTGG